MVLKLVALLASYIVVKGGIQAVNSNDGIALSIPRKAEVLSYATLSTAFSFMFF